MGQMFECDAFGKEKRSFQISTLILMIFSIHTLSTDKQLDQLTVFVCVFKIKNHEVNHISFSKLIYG